MQKYVDLQSMGKKPQIITAFAAEHVKGAIFIEAYKKNDIYEVWFFFFFFLIIRDLVIIFPDSDTRN